MSTTHNVSVKSHNSAAWLLFIVFIIETILYTSAVKIKRCGEMARKLRYFKDQMSKAGLTPAAITDAQTDTNLDDLEVSHDY